jgi:hypothetical protein
MHLEFGRLFTREARARLERQYQRLIEWLPLVPQNG